MFKKALLFMSAAALLQAETKATFDLGSGSFRVLVADVHGKEIKIKYSKAITVELAKDLLESPDQMLSDAVQRKALVALKDLKSCAEKHGATEFKGVATEAWRKAKNGELFLNLLKQNTGINDLQIISQKEEGILGFRTAMAFFPNLNDEDLIVWDIGGGSFQLTAKNGEEYEVYGAPLGNSILPKVFEEEVRKLTSDPITFAHCSVFINALQDRLTAPDWLIRKLTKRGTTVAALAALGGSSPFAKAAEHLGCDTYSKDQVKALTAQIAEAPGAKIELVQRLCLVCAVMEKFGIPEITFKQRISGNALGLI